MEPNSLKLEYRTIGYQDEVAMFDNVKFTYIEGQWIKTSGAGGDAQRELRESPHLDVAGLEDMDRSIDWNFIFFSGPGEDGREIKKITLLPNKLVRFTLKGS